MEMWRGRRTPHCMRWNFVGAYGNYIVARQVTHSIDLLIGGVRACVCACVSVCMCVSETLITRIILDLAATKNFITSECFTNKKDQMEYYTQTFVSEYIANE